MRVLSQIYKRNSEIKHVHFIQAVFKRIKLKYQSFKTKTTDKIKGGNGSWRILKTHQNNL